MRRVFLLSFSLLALGVGCGDDSASSETSEDNSSQVADETIACTAALEGSIEIRWEGNEKYGSGHYEKCVGGQWIEIPETDVKCPKDAAVGDTCSVAELFGFFYRYHPDFNPNTYVYTEEKQWLLLDPAACTKEREGGLRTSYNSEKNTTITKCASAKCGKV